MTIYEKYPNLNLPEIVEKIAYGTPELESYIVDKVLEDYDADIEDDINEILEEANLERCWECNWWCDCGELVNEDGEIISCFGCGENLQHED